MSKVIFVLHKRQDLSREQMVEQWSGEQHTSIVTAIPGLSHLVQNRVVASPGAPVCDGIGELWFDTDAAMQHGLNSPQMAAAVEDAKRFLDMDRTGLLIVEETTITERSRV